MGLLNFSRTTMIFLIESELYKSALCQAYNKLATKSNNITTAIQKSYLSNYVASSTFPSPAVQITSAP